MRSDELAARGFDEFFLAVGDREISIGVDVTDVSSLEPAVLEGVLGFFGTIPVCLEDGGAADQNFAVFGDANF